MQIQITEPQIERLACFYRQCHEHPEPSGREEKTSRRVAEALRDLGIETTTGVGGFGVVGRLDCGSGPIVLLRADMDALPITEQTGLPYASRRTVTDGDGPPIGYMHACGHDMHTSCLLGAAEQLVRLRSDLAGTVLLVAQPAEETASGAQAMLDDGLYERFGVPSSAVALHVDPVLPAGQVALRPGPMMASADTVAIEIFGRGGHGALPHTTIDPIVEAAQLILSLQTIVSREIDPNEAAVVTVAGIHGGNRSNIIADRCRLQLTVRTYRESVRQKVLDSLRRKARAVAMAAGAPEPRIDISTVTPSVFNDPELFERFRKAFGRLIGPENVVEADRSMGSEDFSRFGQGGIPLCFYRLGCVSRERLNQFAEKGLEPPSLHSPLFYPDVEPTLAAGIGTLTAAVVELIGKTA